MVQFAAGPEATAARENESVACAGVENGTPPSWPHERSVACTASVVAFIRHRPPPSTTRVKRQASLPESSQCTEFATRGACVGITSRREGLKSPNHNQVLPPTSPVMSHPSDSHARTPAHHAMFRRASTLVSRAAVRARRVHTEAKLQEMGIELPVPKAPLGKHVRASS